ncbi:hypothetical protein SDRG_13367 [Saprolegnia diclina VS20]|uniref:Uncharacterized protein n=1 Tax=Saprolegnia diclina (strain VS20) TaxID=1156394 RepID=T0Q5Y6_SAPDV|nr:hypothetical protein SDRG_13367 [Saprolegnia diclina VS20]EQC28855.1 hypothetical protein SDRG_13367 [Saprolegnia diclina VS20]|eukprot:XP_008617672.1 hypothetical protein SDRG_13367 [Saprolegnia diclina VS20]
MADLPRVMALPPPRFGPAEISVLRKLQGVFKIVPLQHLVSKYSTDPNAPTSAPPPAVAAGLQSAELSAEDEAAMFRIFGVDYARAKQNVVDIRKAIKALDNQTQAETQAKICGEATAARAPEAATPRRGASEKPAAAQRSLDATKTGCSPPVKIKSRSSRQAAASATEQQERDVKLAASMKDAFRDVMTEFGINAQIIAQLQSLQAAQKGTDEKVARYAARMDGHHKEIQASLQGLKELTLKNGQGIEGLMEQELRQHFATSTTVLAAQDAIVPRAIVLTDKILSPGSKKPAPLPEGYKGPFYAYFIDELTNRPALDGEPIKIEAESLTRDIIRGAIAFAERGLEWGGAANNALLMTSFVSPDAAAVVEAALETTKFAVDQFKSVVSGPTREDAESGSAAFRDYVLQVDPKKVFGGLKRHALVEGPVVWCLDTSMEAYRKMLHAKLKNREVLFGNNDDMVIDVASDDDDDNDNNDNNDDKDDAADVSMDDGNNVDVSMDAGNIADVSMDDDGNNVDVSIDKGYLGDEDSNNSIDA